MQTKNENSAIKGEIFGYARVSSKTQSLDIQLKRLQDTGFNFREIYQEKQSGATLQRIEFNKMYNNLREHDTVVITAFDRLGRNTYDLMKLIKEFQESNITLISLKDNYNSQHLNPTQVLLFGIMANFSEYERTLIAERRDAGIARAKELGKYTGRKRVPKPQNFDECFKRYMTSNRLDPYKFRHFLKDTNLKPSTLNKFIQAEKIEYNKKYDNPNKENSNTIHDTSTFDKNK